MKTVALSVLLAVTGRTATADPAPPAWCQGVGTNHGTSPEISLDPDREPSYVLPFLRLSLCNPTDEERPRLRELEAARQQWMKRMAMTEADWAADVPQWLQGPKDPVLLLPDKQPWSKLTPLDQFALLIQTGGYSDSFALLPGAKHYMADAFALSETGRLAYISKCLETNFSDGVKPVTWAVCQRDIDLLDRAKLGQEVRGDTTHTAADRMRVRFMLGTIDQRIAAQAAKMRALFAKDKAYKTLFDTARAARAEWDMHASERTAALALVSALDDARATRSRSALAGCADKAWAVFASALGKLSAKRFDNLRGELVLGPLVQDPEVYLAANALIACEGPSDYFGEELERALTYWPGFRGPRTAAFSTLATANIELDERGARLDIPGSRIPLAIGDEKSAYRDDDGTGVVAAVSERGDEIEIKFAKTSEVQDHCNAYRNTSRVSHFDSSGNVVYERTCTSWSTERTDTTPKPVTIPKRYRAGVQKGRAVRIVDGRVLGVWAKPKAATPLAAFGVVLRE